MTQKRILVISSHYPPFHLGGYELRCKHIMDALAQRGHEILVITSNKEQTSHFDQPEITYPIYRNLHVRRVVSLIDRMTLHWWSYPLGMLLVFVRDLWISWVDTAFIDRQIKQFRPDIVYLGHILPLSKLIVPYLADSHLPVIFDDGGSTVVLTQENKGVWFRFIEEYVSRFSILNLVKHSLVNVISLVSGRRIKTRQMWPQKMKVLFNSEFGLQAAVGKKVPVQEARVIRSGVNTDLFSFMSRQQVKSHLVIIAPGRREPSKGQIDAVRLLARLLGEGLDVKLFLVGGVGNESYSFEIEKDVKALGLETSVTSLPMVKQDKLVSLYQQADICFFPSYQEPGFSRTPLEAMACGSIVITYGNEGSREFIRNRQNGFLVSPADYASLVNIIKELAANPTMVDEITREARKEVEEFYSMSSYVDRIEAEILSLAVGN